MKTKMNWQRVPVHPNSRTGEGNKFCRQLIPYIAYERNHNLLRVLDGKIFSAMNIHISELLINVVARLISSYNSDKIN